MDAFGISGLMTNDRDTRVDVPLRVFSRTYYPNLVELYKLIGVEIKVRYAFSWTNSMGLDHANRMIDPTLV